MPLLMKERQVVIVARELSGETLTHVAKTEADGVPFVMATIAAGATVHADEASHWDNLEGRFLTKRINHSEAYYKDGACTNMAEASSAAFVAPKSARITTSRAATCNPTRWKWRGAKTTAAFPTASNS